MATEWSVPEPKGWPIIGNILDIDLSFPLGSFEKWADEYPDLFRVRFPGRNMIFVNTQALAHELCDETRFRKTVVASLVQIRNGVHNGLFTADTEDPAWGLAHRVLMPAFGPMPIQDMFGEMHEIAAQLVLKWARHPSTTPIMVTDDFTRLTLDTLALCSMGFRFNSFYHDKMHPFIAAMGEFLVECGTRATLPPFIGQSRFRGATKKYWENIDVLRKTASEVLVARKEHPTGRKDLLSAMLDGVDPKTGQKLSDDAIIDNLITFLIAGHETTSGLLSFAVYQLIKHPAYYRKAQQEVDTVIGTGPIKAEHMTKLPYVSAVLRETLRHSPTIPTFFVNAIEDTVIGGKYPVPAGQPFAILLSKMHTDPKVHGDTAKDFIPDRMLDENFERINKEFPDFWKPFGNGQRGCIGRGFAWQEAVLCMAMILQNLELSLDDPEYKLHIKQTLTTKPKDFYMRARLREGIEAVDLGARLSGGGGASVLVNGVNGKAGQGKANAQQQREGKPMSIFYGSNTGTCEAFAERLAADAVLHGYEAAVVEPLDKAKAGLPKGQPVVVITASYEGQPPDNAKEFCDWVQGLKGSELDKTQFAVFGCGHHDWTQTFHRVPKLVDETMGARGGDRICPMGLADAAAGQIFTDFEQWEDEVFWPAVEEKYGTPIDGEDGLQVAMSNLSVEFSSPRTAVLRQDVMEVVVVEAKSLTEAKGAEEKRHLEVQLPAGITYRAGDYLAVLPVNPPGSISRVMRRFHISQDANITISCDGRTSLPTGAPVSVYDILSSYVELAQPATKRSIVALAESTASPEAKTALLSLANVQYTSEVSRKRTSLLALLERFPSTTLPFSTFLSLLPPIRIRTYSISSSPLRDPSRATLTYSVLAGPSLSEPSVQHVGVASSYLASLTPGDKLAVSVRTSHAAFHLPSEPENIPIVLVAAGAGLAPFRGFIQERAAQIAAGRDLAPALLFFGCRGPEVDDLYRDDLNRWEKMGAVSVRRAYSRDTRDSLKGRTKGCRYVQERLWEDRLDLMDLWDKGSKTYVCGSRAVGENVKKTVIRVAMEMQRLKVERGESEDEPSEQRAMKWFESILNERYAVDLFD
ncbi:putative bifunctional P-450:NADPH-P450 reductase [Cercophora newfieldiana]|uniref:Bifunctional cytochrome P450/NADPH--P450 reductase n=1 Tax=Cercophora newfieldiana TaxID=92897 RepID=A0AA39Y3K2_9PEZI|nr:putative bifunctional P-450:NADPH-P450 reductase [Cercophora newfieldiana]